MAERKRYNPNEEIEEYRNLLETPSTFEEGFTKPAILGVLFVGFIMIPGNMYLNLMVGGSLGAAAEWVTIILFAEVTKRSFITLKRQEVYLLYYVASGLIAAEHGSFDGLLWNQYLVQSPAAEQFGISKLIPTWWAPPVDSPALAQRTLLHADWVKPIILVISGAIIMRLSWFTMSYMLFRINSDYERLPFPFAPVAAQGATALAESSRGEETWRWRVFSSGAMIGLVFGAIYVGIPAITGAFLTEPIQLIPIPWIDFTQITGNFIPAAPLGFTAHLGPIFAGLVMPFWGVVGTFSGVVLQVILNPILYNQGILQMWQPGMGAVETFFVNSVDFWMSFGIGITIAIALIGIYQVVRGVRTAAGQKAERSFEPPKGRGDFPMWVAFGLYCVATSGIILLAWVFLPAFNQFVWFFLFFGFVFTPFQSFVNARLVGMVGQTVSIPFIREATIILSGYQGVDIWFIPFPLGNYGNQTQKFREIELTGTKFTSIAKAELFMIPIILGTTFIYSAYIWRLAPVPSASYPFAQLMWRLRAMQTCIWYTGTMTSELRRDDVAHEAEWEPANLIDEEWWHWRGRVVSPEWLETDGRRGEAGPWSEVRRFYTSYDVDMRDRDELPPPPLGALEPDDEVTTGPALEVLGPDVVDGIVTDARPPLHVRATEPVPEGWVYYYVIDTDPNFGSPWIQRSTDEPWLFRAINKNYIFAGTITGLVMFIVLSILGLPVLMVFGSVRALTIIPHMMLTEMVGALLARYYFWNKYGKKQWRLYAPILAVGFAAGMALMGMASIAIALIQKSVSVLVF